MPPSKTTHTAPDGRTFTTSTGVCICAATAPCWRGKCQCGEFLTKHDYDEESAVRGCLEAMGREHATC